MFWRHFIFTIFWAVSILVLYGIPGSSIPKVDFWSSLGPDKVAHCIIFLVLMCSLSFSVFKQSKYPALRRKTIRNSALVCLVYGIMLELMQSVLFTERYTDILDGLANAAGVLLGIVILKIFFRDTLT
ncbi:MAG: VanZ family protein [Flavobacteriales bacterium]